MMNKTKLIIKVFDADAQKWVELSQTDDPELYSGALSNGKQVLIFVDKRQAHTADPRQAKPL